MRAAVAIAVAAAVIASLTSAGARVPAPAEAFTVGTLHVERHGTGGRPVVLVPGLASGGWVWADTVAWLARERAVYVVTLAGFDGRPAPAGEALLHSAFASLVSLLEGRRLERPVIVGHSLGGVLALWLATEQAARLGGVVTVDGLPVLPGAEAADATRRAAVGAELRRRMEGLDPAAFQAQQLAFMKGIGVVDPAEALRLASLTARSDPRAVGLYAGEAMALDLRPALPRAQVPILALVPYHGPDHAAPPTAMTEAEKIARYRALFAGAPNVKVAAIAGARHFAMVDQPAAFRRELEAFLAGR